MARIGIDRRTLDNRKREIRTLVRAGLPGHRPQDRDDYDG